MIEERYATARNASNLKSEPRTAMSASDVIMAAGMAAHEHEIALLLWGVAFKGRTSDKMALADALTKHVSHYLQRKRLSGNPRELSCAAIAWFMSKCPACGGEGHEIVPDTITRSDEICPACGGNGKLPKPRDTAFYWLADEVERFASIAAGAVMRKLNTSISA